MWTKLVVTTLLCLLETVLCFPDGRIVNGIDSTISRHPHIASLRLYDSHFCGCSIIATSWVLSAAHCVDGYSFNALSVQYGLTIISDLGPNVVPIKRYIIHENYSPQDMWINDITLIELKQGIYFNYITVAPVTLPEPYFEFKQLPGGIPVVLAGWGLNDTHGVKLNTLQEVDLKIFSDRKCQSIHQDLYSIKQFCAGVDEGRKGSCNSDSGGPLILDDKIQVGIVSFGETQCASSPGIYVKVSHYINWIHKHIY